MQNLIRSLMRIMTHLVKYDRDMTLQRAKVLFVVVEQDGCLVRDIVKRTGLHQSSVARSLAFLGDRPMRGNKEGLRWIEMKADEEDSRRNRAYLTDKGKHLMSVISDLVG